ncbi:MAG: MBL fold metallo-hydrolase [Paracoccus sp. (in: a-proteobacteria)]|uniref:MBL fold metallo-hydrolase n=1 Tax=Paracoccus sp. TaxID=267 RepID=UPI0039E58DB2
MQFPEMPHNPLPREIAPGVFWLSECFPVLYNGTWLHTYNAAFLVVGEKSAALIETGITAAHLIVLEQVDQILAGRDIEVEYVFVTHSEMSHCGGVGKVLGKFPKARMIGEVCDLHLVFPQFEDRIEFAEPGDSFDLGGRALTVHESVFRDLIHSRWFFDTGANVLFTGDGFAYSHVHDACDCGHLAEEATTLKIDEQMQRFAFSAFHWTQFVDIEPYVERMDDLLHELDVRIVAPTHGLPITDLSQTMPIVREGFRGMKEAAIAEAARRRALLAEQAARV